MHPKKSNNSQRHIACLKVSEKANKKERNSNPYSPKKRHTGIPRSHKHARTEAASSSSTHTLPHLFHIYIYYTHIHQQPATLVHYSLVLRAQQQPPALFSLSLSRVYRSRRTPGDVARCRMNRTAVCLSIYP